MKGWWFFILSSCFYQNIEISSGTPSRIEKEYKLAFSTTISIDEVALRLQKKIFFEIKKEKGFKASAFLNEPYFLTGKLDPFLFLDFYMDTEDFLLTKKNAIYRLRYRWKSESFFEKYRESFLEAYLPIRVEVQSKTDIKYLSDFMATGMESRFEFKDDSLPFSKENPAPRPPWPLKNFLEIARTGKYEEYKLLPYQDISDLLEGDFFITPKYIIKTARRRLHLNMINPWGSGPNPNQVFIITVDHFKYKKFENIPSSYSDDFKGNFYEVEIEFERNTSTNVYADNSVKAKEIKQLFFKDHQLLKNIIVKFFNEEKILISSKAMNKLTRVKMDEMDKAKK